MRDITVSVNIDASQIEKLATSVSNHPSLTQLATSVSNHLSLTQLATNVSNLRKEVAQSATLEVVQTEDQGSSNFLNTLESQVIVICLMLW